MNASAKALYSGP